MAHIWSDVAHCSCLWTANSCSDIVVFHRSSCACASTNSARRATSNLNGNCRVYAADAADSLGHVTADEHAKPRLPHPNESAFTALGARQQLSNRAYIESKHAAYPDSAR